MNAIDNKFSTLGPNFFMDDDINNWEMYSNSEYNLDFSSISDPKYIVNY